MVELEPVIKSLVANEVKFVIIGGVAIIFHGSAYATQDLDVCFLRTKENIKRIVNALEQFKPRARDFPENLPFAFDETTLQSGTNFTFVTDLGDIDLLGEVAGVGDYAEAENNSIEMEIFDRVVRILSLEALIKAKRAAGRTKDLLVLPELEALLELKNEADN